MKTPLVALRLSPEVRAEIMEHIRSRRRPVGEAMETLADWIRSAIGMKLGRIRRDRKRDLERFQAGIDAAREERNQLMNETVELDSFPPSEDEQ